MELRPEGIERWGVRKIVTESNRLVREHHRLFLPFYLAFSLSGSLLSWLPLVFVRSNAQEIHQVPTHIITVLTMVNSYIVVPTLTTLGLGGVAYIVAYIYSNDDADTDDTNVTQKVFNLLPHALWRSFVTALWTWLLLMLVSIAHFLFGLLLCTIIGSKSEYFLVLAMLPWFISALFLSFIFVFSQVIAVLEPLRYGKEALDRSAKMVKVGGAGTILAVCCFSFWLFAVFGYFPSTRMATMKPGWILYAVGVFNAVLISVLNLYFYVVSVVMYFVYTSRVEADVSALPKFAASEEHPYKPLADEAPPVGEP